MTRLFSYGALSSLKASLTASLFATLVACGSVKNNDQPDAAIDSPPPAPVQLTALTTVGDGLPDPTAIAVFVDSSNKVVKDGPVSDLGKAEALLPTGGTVHLIKVTEVGTTRTVLIQTFRGVKAGDVLTGGLRQRPGFRAGATTTMNGTFTSLGTGYTYQFSSECGANGVGDPGGATGAVAINFADSCHDATIEMLATSTNGVTGVNPRFVFTSFNHVSGGTFTVPNAWGVMSNFNLTVSNLPDEITTLSGTRYSYLTPTSALVQAGQFMSVTGDPPAGNNTMIIPYPAGVGTRAMLQTVMTRTGAASAQEVWTRTPTLTAALTVDATALPLPWITSLPTATPTGVTWTQDGTGTPDLRVAAWFGSFTAAGFTTTVAWYMADDGSGGPAVTLPALPATYAAYDPTQQTATPVLARLFVIDRSDLAGYDQARPNMFEYFNSPTAMGLDADKAFQMRRVFAAGRGPKLAADPAPK